MRYREREFFNAMNTEYGQKVSERFPNLEYGELKAVDNRQERFAIDDLSYKNPSCRTQFREAMELFTLACTGYVNIYTAEGLAISLNRQLEDLIERLDPERTLFIFPGNGARATKELLPGSVLNTFSSVDLNVCRKVLPDMSISGVEVLTSKPVIKQALPKRLENCVLVDDVVGSRTTALAVKSAMDQDSRYEWYAASWMTLSPLQVRGKKEDQFQSGILGFRKAITALVYQGESGNPANNSLSSFIGSDPRSQTVTERYREKFAEDRSAFDEAIDIMRRLSNG
jgi:hypothetical protein